LEHAFAASPNALRCELGCAPTRIHGCLSEVGMLQYDERGFETTQKYTKIY